MKDKFYQRRQAFIGDLSMQLFGIASMADNGQFSREAFYQALCCVAARLEKNRDWDFYAPE